MASLASWGFGPFFSSQVQLQGGVAELAPARVIRVRRSRFGLAVQGGEVEAELKGTLRRAAELGEVDAIPVIGDFVLARGVEAALGTGGIALVESVLERKSRLARKGAGRATEAQVLAANVDVALIVTALDGDFSVRRIERYLVMAHAGGVEPVVVLGKADKVLDWSEQLAEAEKVAGGAPVIPISARTGLGLGRLESEILLPGRTVALLGSSGVGKSTLVNRLLGEERQRTSEIREGDDTGRHTTTDRTLVPLASGAILVDGPGLREIEPWSDEGGIEAAFSEIEALAEGCRFRDCRHDGEPGCAVAAALENGELTEDRIESHRRLEKELAHQARRRDVHAALEEKRKWKIIHKAQKKLSRDR